MNRFNLFYRIAVPLKDDSVMVMIDPAGVNYHTYHYRDADGMEDWNFVAAEIARHAPDWLRAVDRLLIPMPMNSDRSAQEDAAVLDRALGEKGIPRERIALLCGAIGNGTDYRASGFLTIFDQEGPATDDYDGIFLAPNDVYAEHFMPGFIDIIENRRQYVTAAKGGKGLTIADGITDRIGLRIAKTLGVDYAFGVADIVPEPFTRDQLLDLIRLARKHLESYEHDA